jgi:hypothetical protein
VRSIAELVIAATIATIVGSFLGSRLVKKLTMRTGPVVVAIGLVAVGAGMAIGSL